MVAMVTAIIPAAARQQSIRSSQVALSQELGNDIYGGARIGVVREL
jgi:hypothetical protein